MGQMNLNKANFVIFYFWQKWASIDNKFSSEEKKNYIRLSGWPLNREMWRIKGS